MAPPRTLERQSNSTSMCADTEMSRDMGEGHSHGVDVLHTPPPGASIAGFSAGSTTVSYRPETCAKLSSDRILPASALGGRALESGHWGFLLDIREDGFMIDDSGLV